MKFLADNWWLVSAMAVAAISIINAVTSHWSTKGGLVKWLSLAAELLSLLTSKDAPGVLKFPLTSRPPGKRSAEGTKLPFVILLFTTLLTASSCSAPLSPVRCRHARGLQAGNTWSTESCLKAQARRNWLLGAATALAIAGGAGGIAAVVPADQPRWKLGAGIASAALAVGAAVLAPFVASAQKNLSEHCVEYTMVPR